ncbi:MAG TPA: T9SS type A sorting domain-containing protein [Ignavibacteria bacterium]|jgi:hypothetical protein
MNSAVFALTVYNGSLIAGGNFTIAGGNNITAIAKWNSSSWSQVDTTVFTGTSVSVNSLLVQNSNLFAGGSFQLRGGQIRNAAKWDGNAWAKLGPGPGPDNAVYALEIYSNNLVAGGSFITAGGVTLNYIASLQYLPIGITPISNNVPKSFSLFQNYPNPFNPVTKVRFQIPLLRDLPAEVSAQAGVSADGGRGVLTELTIYDLLGREIAILVNEQLQPGTYEVSFDGSSFSSGIYFYRLSTGDYTESKKMILIK